MSQEFLFDLFELRLVLLVLDKQLVPEILVQLFLIVGSNSQFLFNHKFEIAISIIFFESTPNYIGVLFDDDEFTEKKICRHLLDGDQLVSILAQPLKFIDFYPLYLLLLCHLAE